MRIPVALGLLLVLAGCAGRGPTGDPGPSDGVAGTSLALEYHLKPGHVLSQVGPASSAPQKVYAAPTANAYVNEDVEVFTAPHLAGGFVARSIVFEVHYAVDRATGDAFRNGTNPFETRHFVFWLGSAGIYPMFETVWGPAVVQPGTVYAVRLTFHPPAGGWYVPAGEPLMLLVAPLIAEAGPSNLHYLVDHPRADSRILLEGESWTPLALGAETPTEETVTVTGNSGLFTGLGPAQLSTVERPVPLGAGDGLVRIEVRWRSTQGGKSDLDLTLLDSERRAVAASTTPYQSETIRLFAPQVAALGAGAYTLHVDAYSGLDTSFRLAIVRASAG
jgi:hypothetical protein